MTAPAIGFDWFYLPTYAFLYQTSPGGLWALEGSLGESLLRPAPATEAPEALTPREAEVLALLGEGLSNRAIADRLGISERTAKFHASSILAKLGAASRAEAIVRAARLGLLVI